MKNKFHLIEALTEEIDFTTLCFSETWISTAKTDLLSLEGYTLASHFSRTNREGGGVCILVKDQIQFIELEEIKMLSVEYIVELCAIEFVSLNTVLIVIYWPDSKREVATFNTQLDKLFKLLTTKYLKKNIVIGGDLNIDFLSNSTETRNLTNLFKSHNFYQNIKEPTRITATSSTCLDVIFTNFDTTDLDIHVKEYGLSDHKGIFLSLNRSKNNINCKETYTVNKRKFNEQNLASFKNKLQSINWQNVFSSDKDVNKNYMAFHDQLTTILNTCIPRKYILIKNKLKAWLTKGIKVSCKNKRLLKILKSQINSETLNEYYKTYVKTLKKIVISSKKNQYINKIRKSKNVTKSMWQIIKERTNKLNKKMLNNIEIIHNGENLTEPLLVANTLNNYFVSVGSNKMKGQQPAGRPVKEPVDNTMYLNPVTETEVAHIIKTLKNKTSYGYDEFPPTLIKYCKDELVAPLTYLINQSFNESTFPDLLKITIVKPIAKKRNAKESQNFRPIALLSTFSKIFESAMAIRLKSFCEKYNIFHECQYGFRKHKSTVAAVYKYINEILNIIDNHKYAIGVMLDMSKAYDRVSHKILLQKLYGVGIRGVAYKWFASYLKNREQFVEIEHYNNTNNILGCVRSQKLCIERSIPQGSVLGCILFLIYINDVSKCIDKKCILYADDISIVFSCATTEELQKNICSTIEDITDWLLDHNLEINLSKTKLMQFKPRQKQKLQTNITVNNNKNLEFVTSSTLLGIEIDCNLNWKPHIEKIASKLSKFTYALFELKKCTDLNTATTAYYAYAHAWLNYGIILWGNSSHVNSLFVLQKRCIRILVNITDMESCRPYFVKLSILTLSCMYIFEICKLVKKNLHEYSQAKDFYNHPRNLRNKNRLNRPFTKLHLVSSGTYHMSIKIYNKIPSEIKNISAETLFLKKLKEWLIDKCFYTIEEYLKY